MMKAIRNILMTIVVVTLVGSCESYLDVPPDATITEDQIFGTYFTFQGFIDQMYEKVVDYNQHAICCSQNMGGETIATQGWTNSYMASRGDYFAIVENSRSNYIGYNGEGIWDYSWQGIRIANIAIQNLGRLVNPRPEDKAFLEAQAYFFRAFFHWEILRAYGTIPYIDTVLVSDFKLPRHWEYNGKIDYQAVTERIVEDLDKAIPGLPARVDNTQWGRATRGAAMALKAKALLFAGSPLMNEFSGNSDTFNDEYMERAAEAAADVINLDVYDLVPWDEYQSNFATNDAGSFPYTTETIWQRHDEYKGSGRITNSQGRLYLPAASVFGGNAITECPTQEYVDKFELEDGTRYLPGPASLGGYDEDNYLRWDARDPRFRAAIYVDGDMAGYDPTTILTLYEGGDTRKKSFMLTPYVVHKFWPLGVNQVDQIWSEFRFVTPQIRYAEVLLIYAEALYELTGDYNASADNSDLTAAQAVNLVRERAGMPDVETTIPSYDNDFRELVRNERAVELCFEGHYWFDLRRWKTAKDEHPDGLYGLSFDENYSYFNREVVAPFIFEDRHYWLPFPKSEVFIFKEFEQNPGW